LNLLCLLLIFSILKQALTSASPLSDVFLGNKGSKPYSFSPYTGPNHEKGSVEIKVIVSKSENKILFAEADGDFVDFLFSFLTTPLGSILHLMNGKSSLGSIDNLYKMTDDLKVISMATNSSIDYLRGRSLQLDDLEEHFVEIKRSHEALNLLRASLTSDKDVFTRSLSNLLKVWKCQRCIPYWGVLKGWNEKRQIKKKEKEEKEGEREVQ
ncbi:hypothetical protein CR513_55704, partial [Mucuna pruriens]